VKWNTWIAKLKQRKLESPRFKPSGSGSYCVSNFVSKRNVFIMASDLSDSIALFYEVIEILSLLEESGWSLVGDVADLEESFVCGMFPVVFGLERQDVQIEVKVEIVSLNSRRNNNGNT
jgi:hypothetical protein